jgi:ABC-type Mn2+/Zn2+ transport system permease subunit/Mn-dependent DtxR family transcriptional regulator
MIHALLEPWSHPYFVKAAVGGSIVAVSCAVLGCYIVLRRMAFIGDAMSHALLPGVGVGYLVMNAVFPEGFTAGGLLLGALIAALLTSVCISFLSAVPRIKEDSAIGIIYTGLFAAGVVILTRWQQHINIDLNHFFQGDIYGISWPDLWLSAVVGSVVIGTIVIFYRHFTIVSFDPIMAASIGMPTRLLHIVLTAMIALVCVSGISMVGVIMIVGLLITPAAMAYLLTDRLPVMMGLAAIAGMASVIGGLYFSEWVNASGGGAIMLMGFLLFLAGLVLAPRYGLIAAWVRKRAVAPQVDLEDVLKAAYPGGQGWDSVTLPTRRMERAVRKLTATDMLTARSLPDRILELTDRGRKEAAHILRAHQLWEGHLIQTGLPPPEAHLAAERLEHLHPRDVLDHFDDELGHPVYDFDGNRVPGESSYRSEACRPLRLSLMREGDQGRFVGCLAPWPDGITEGDRFRVGPRELDTNHWHIRTHQGADLVVPHETADHLLVEPTGEEADRQQTGPRLAPLA